MKAPTDTDVGTFLCIYIRYDGGAFHVAESYWDEIDAAFHQYVERNINRVLSLTNTNGADLLLPACQIGAVLRTTPESRERQRKLDAASKIETGFQE